MGGLKDYFSFSKRERTGAIVLLILIVGVFLLPEFYPEPKFSMDENSISAFKKQAAEWKASKSDSSTNVWRRRSDPGDVSRYPPSAAHEEKARMFYFDPNTISEDEWRKLGISDRTINTIKTYILKGGSFRKAEDIGKIYGLKAKQYEQLLPYVRIKHRDEKKIETPRNYRETDYNKTDIRIPEIIEINSTDTSRLIALPGIGSKLANRIVLFRDKLGGFYSTEQVKEIYGLPDSTFQNIKSFLQCNSSAIQKINVNTADVASLKNHPYIKWNIANAIINYRSQHGEYKSVEDLLKIDILSTEILQKISPYLTVN